MTAPLVTVAVPVHNEARYLRATLDAILAQEGVAFEVIVGDNASTDASAAIAEEVAACEGRVRVLRHPVNIGMVRNNNALLAEARGRYFSWAGGHDLRDPGQLAACVAVLEADPGVVLAATASRLVGPDGEDLGVADAALETRGLDRAARVRRVLWAMARMRSMDPVLGVFRTEALRRTPGFENLWGCDNLLLLRLAIEGAFAHLPRPLLVRRVQRDPWTSLPEQVEGYMVRLDPANAQARWRPAYGRLLARYLGVLRAAPLPASQRAALMLHAVAASARFLPEMIVHDAFLGAVRLALGPHAVRPAARPFDWVARRTRYSWRRDLRPRAERRRAGG